MKGSKSKFNLKADFSPAGDQPRAIKELEDGVGRKFDMQTLQGVTGSGKTFMAANLIQKLQKPTLVISHNKTLAAQLCAEYKRFFPDNSVEYFVSYYDYYQPEAYLPGRDMYIEKDADINEEIERLRHAATRSLMDRKDVIVVASVSCIYGLGSPEEYANRGLYLEVGQEMKRTDLMGRLIEIQYERNDFDFARGKFRVRGNKIDINPAFGGLAFRIFMEGDMVTDLKEIDPLTGRTKEERSRMIIYPATHFVMPLEQMERAADSISLELEERLEELRSEGKELEAARLRQRTRHDLEMIREVNYCKGIENYSRHFDGREPGEPPFTLLDYFPDDFLMIIDESHVTLPQIRAMYGGDRSRKENLVDYGFRLPSAKDNRPLQFHEFREHMNNVIFTTATPGSFENENSRNTVEVIIRPTGLVDPDIDIRPTGTQVDDLMNEIQKHTQRRERVLVTTLTKRMAEDLSEYLAEHGIKADYMHSDTSTMDRIEILRKLRLGEINVLVGINLLREGLDLPEVTLVAILDADKEGFLRNETTLIQTMGRAARNVKGKVILYADSITGSIMEAVKKTRERRKIQVEYNRSHGIYPATITKEVTDITDGMDRNESKGKGRKKGKKGGIRERLDLDDIPLLLIELEEEMKRAAENLEFEKAAMLRDRIFQLKRDSDLIQ